MNILCIFAGQGYKNNTLFNFFQNDDKAQALLNQLSDVMHLGLQSNLELNDLNSVQSIIGAYQYVLFNLIKPLFNAHSVDLAGYSLGEVNAYLASINASPQQVKDVLSYRTQLMMSLLQGTGSLEYDLLFIRGHFLLEEIHSLCAKHQCFVAIVNADQRCVLGGTLADLKALVLELPQYHVTQTKFLDIGLPSHTPFYQDKKGLFYHFLNQQKYRNLHYPILNPLQLGKIVDVIEEQKVLDEELYTTLQWFQLCELIKEYNYDLIIDLGPGDAMTKLLHPNQELFNSLIITASNYSNCSSFRNALHALVRT